MCDHSRWASRFGPHIVAMTQSNTKEKELTLSDLIEILTGNEQNPVLLEKFFLVYRSFSSPSLLLRALSMRFESVNILSFQQKCVRFLIEWVENHSYDFMEGLEISEFWKDFKGLIKKICRILDLYKKGKVILATVEGRLKLLFECPGRQFLVAGVSPVFHSEVVNFLTVDLLVFAKQMTLIASHLYHKIHPFELLEEESSCSVVPQKVNLAVFENHVTRISRWSTFLLLTYSQKIQEHVFILEQFISLSHILMGLGNFSDALSIYESLSSSPLFKMNFEDFVSSHSRDVLSHVSMMWDNKFERMKEEVKLRVSGGFPCILSLRILQQTSENFEFPEEEGVAINYGKYTTQINKLRLFYLTKKEHYNFPVVANMRNYIEQMVNLPHFSDSDCHMCVAYLHNIFSQELEESKHNVWEEMESDQRLLSQQRSSTLHLPHLDEEEKKTEREQDSERGQDQKKGNHMSTVFKKPKLFLFAECNSDGVILKLVVPPGYPFDVESDFTIHESGISYKQTTFCGTLPRILSKTKLIEKLTSTEDHYLSLPFLLTFRSFSTPGEVLSLVCSRLPYPSLHHDDMISQEKYQRYVASRDLICKCTLEFLGKWMDNFPKDFQSDPLLLLSIQEWLVEVFPSVPSMQPPLSSLIFNSDVPPSIIEFLEKLHRRIHWLTRNTTNNTKSVNEDKQPTNNCLETHSFHFKEFDLAHQIAFMSWKFFQQIPISDFLDTKYKLSPSQEFINFAAWAERISYLVSSEISERTISEDEKKRSLSHWFRTAFILLDDCHDWHSALGIFQGINKIRNQPDGLTLFDGDNNCLYMELKITFGPYAFSSLYSIVSVSNNNNTKLRARSKKAKAKSLASNTNFDFETTAPASVPGPVPLHTTATSPSNHSPSPLLTPASVTPIPYIPTPTATPSPVHCTDAGVPTIDANIAIPAETPTPTTNPATVVSITNTNLNMNTNTNIDTDSSINTVKATNSLKVKLHTSQLSPPSVPLLFPILAEIEEVEALNPSYYTTDTRAQTLIQTDRMVEIYRVFNHFKFLSFRLECSYKSSLVIELWINELTPPCTHHPSHESQPNLTGSMMENIPFLKDKQQILKIIRTSESLREEIKNLVRGRVKLDLLEFRKNILPPINVNKVVETEFPGCKLETWTKYDETGSIYGIPKLVEVQMIVGKSGVHLCYSVDVSGPQKKTKSRQHQNPSLVSNTNKEIYSS
eukprot:TRINITY_DN890_c0_g1_i7.p1 TRINITY_DN890_c0_g1~~TRINITY_DN890_c0_g1_i7.p1  ORF type:complete len:1208 (-),score=265.03 TRINITY_DN890_c0_g1_i7:406-4029(-)